MARLKKPRPLGTEWTKWFPVSVIDAEKFRKSRCCGAKVEGTINKDATKMLGTCTQCNQVVAEIQRDARTMENKRSVERPR